MGENAELSAAKPTSNTLKNAFKEAGAEPDECYLFGADQSRQVPDLAIEVVWTSGGIKKLEIYRRLGVAEVWQWRPGAIEVFVLNADRYETSTKSRCLPEVDLALLASFLEPTDGERSHASVPRRAPQLTLVFGYVGDRPATKFGARDRILGARDTKFGARDTKFGARDRTSSVRTTIRVSRANFQLARDSERSLRAYSRVSFDGRRFTVATSGPRRAGRR